MKLEHPLIGMVIRKCVFFNYSNKDIILCWVPSHIGIRGNEKADSATKSALDLPRVKVGVPNTDFNTILTNIFFPLGKMIGMVWLRTSFILSSQSWEIGSPPTGGAGRMKLSCVVPTLVISI